MEKEIYNYKAVGRCIDRSMLLAGWLYSHPGMIVQDGDSYFRYDVSEKSFYWCKPSNRVRKSWMKAYGLNDCLKRALYCFPAFFCFSEVQDPT